MTRLAGGVAGGARRPAHAAAGPTGRWRSRQRGGVASAITGCRPIRRRLPSISPPPTMVRQTRQARSAAHRRAPARSDWAAAPVNSARLDRHHHPAVAWRAAGDRISASKSKHRPHARRARRPRADRRDGHSGCRSRAGPRPRDREVGDVVGGVGARAVGVARPDHPRADAIDWDAPCQVAIPPHVAGAILAIGVHGHHRWRAPARPETVAQRAPCPPRGVADQACHPGSRGAIGRAVVDDDDVRAQRQQLLDQRAQRAAPVQGQE